MWPTVPAWKVQMMNVEHRMIRRENRGGQKKLAPLPLSSTKNPTWPDLRSNPSSRGGNPATNRLELARSKKGVSFFWRNY
jgi:hypothetical protein